MNADVLKGKWKQLRGEVKQWWGISPTTTSRKLTVSVTN